MASNGDQYATASSSYSDLFPADALIDGVTSGANWGLGADGGWSDATVSDFPDYAQVTFRNPQVLNAVTLWTLQDAYASADPPTESTDFTQWGLSAFDVQVWDGQQWNTVASVTDNNLVKRTVTFAPVATTQFRVVCNAGLQGYSRIAELQAWGIAAPSPPLLTGLSKRSGMAGDEVSISGANFSVIALADRVLFDGTPATVTQASSTELDVTVPKGATTGPISITVNGLTTTSTVDFAIASKLTTLGATTALQITSIAPGSGAPGTLVRIYGSGFEADPSQDLVQFYSAQTAQVASASQTGMIAIPPPGAQTGAILVTVDGQTAQSPGPFIFAPVISSITPTVAAIGSTITIKGSSFSGATTVTFSGGAFASGTLQDSNTILVRIPVGAVSGSVKVTCYQLNSNASPQSLTIPVAAPVVSGFSPTGGTLGTTVTITGQNFYPVPENNTVTFNGVPATVTAASTTALTAIVPVAATTGPIAVTVGGLRGVSTGNFTVPTQAAAFVSQSVQTTMVAGQTYPVSITMRNTGSATWTAATNYRLGELDSTVWLGVQRVAVPIDVPPGQSVDFKFTVTAPTIPGSYSFSWEMLQELVAWFGASTPPLTVAVTPVPLSITGFSSDRGTAGDTVTITGTGFSTTPSTNVVTIGGVNATVTSATATSLTVTVPSNPNVGQAPIVVTNAAQTVTSGSVFTWIPKITGFSPAGGPPGTSVTITGTSFSSTPYTVRLNNTQLAVSNANDYQVTAVIPDGATSGPFTLVTEFNQSVTSTASFAISAPTITGFTPTQAQVGDTVVISGTNFSATAAYDSVTFNGAPATISAATSTSLTVKVPPAATNGAIGVTVANQTVMSSMPFTVVPTPTITGITPSSGPIGSIVTITGTNFNPDPSQDTVGIGAQTQTVIAASPTVLRAQIVQYTIDGAIVVRVAGTHAVTGPTFTVTAPPPTIQNLSPSTAPTGTQITISGVNFDASSTTANTVTFNGAPAAVSSATATQLVVTVPDAATSGPVIVTNAAGSSTTVLPVNVAAALEGSTASASSFLSAGYNPSGAINGDIQGELSTVSVGWTDATSGAFPDWLQINFPTAQTVNDVVVYAPQDNYANPVIPTDTMTFTRYGATAFDIQVLQATAWTTVASVTNNNLVRRRVTFAPVSTTAMRFSVNASPDGYSRAVEVEARNDPSDFIVAPTPQPKITSFDPPKATPPVSVTIYGQNFGTSQGPGNVALNGMGIAVTSWSDTQIVVAVPTYAQTGPFSVQTARGIVVNSPTDFEVAAPPPTITSFTPTAGQPGQSVVIQGKNFSTAANGNVVKFGAAVVPANQVTVNSSGQLTVLVPADAPGGDVAIEVDVVEQQPVFSQDPFHVFSTVGLGATPAGQQLYGDTLQVGQLQPVTVWMKNTGTTAWGAGQKFRLGSQDPQDNTLWVSPGRAALTTQGDIAPGQTAEFTFNITAPPNPGDYPFQWQMVQDSVAGELWFGDKTPLTVIHVIAKPVDPGNGGIGYPSADSCLSTPPASTGSLPGLPGLWTNPDRFGTGWQFTFVGAQQFLPVWFTFDGLGRPVWLTGVVESAQIDPNTQAMQYLVTLSWAKAAPSNAFPVVPTSTPVGQAAITFKAGSSVSAAVRWQWNSVGADAQPDECVYDYSHQPSASLTRGLDEVASGPDESYTGAWYAPQQSGWGWFATFGTDASGSPQTTETDVITIFDTKGDPVWLRGTNAPPSLSQQQVPLQYWISHYPGGYPTRSCSTDGCKTDYPDDGAVNNNRFTRSLSSSQTGSASVVANVPAGTANPAAAAVAWPNTPYSNPAAIAKLTDMDLIMVNQTTCLVPAGDTVCHLIVSWSSSHPQALVYQRDRTTNTLSTDPIFSSSSASKKIDLAPGADVQFEMYDGGAPPTGTPLFVSPEVKVPTTAPPAPNAPQSIAAQAPPAGSTSVAIVWQAAASGTAPTSYVLAYGPSTTGPWSVLNANLPTSPTNTSANMAVGGPYYFAVAACSGANNCSAYTVTTTPINVTSSASTPLPPTSVTATAPPSGSGSVPLSWVAAATGPAAAAFDIEYATSTAGPWTQVGSSFTGSAATVTVTANGSYYFGVAACNASTPAQCSAYTLTSAPVTVTLGNPIVPPSPELAKAPAVDPNSDRVGASAGIFSVDQQGNASYQIPIYAPRGAGGLTPTVSLSYNSGSGDGLIGWGWALGGISSISPCRKTQEHGDGASVQGEIQTDPTRGVVYCLDGERMLLMLGSSGSAGATYRLENDSQTLVVVESVISFGTAVTTPSVFAVYGKDGTMRRYGNNSAGTNAALLGYSPNYNDQWTNIVGWYESSLSDSNGNIINFQYTCPHDVFQTSTQQWIETDTDDCSVQTDASRDLAAIVPRSITWSGGEIDFVATVRPPMQQTSSYLIAAQPTVQRYRISEIDVKSPSGTELRRYTPTLSNNPDNANVQQLASLQECAGSTCYAPTSFQWANLGSTIAGQATTSSAAPFHNTSPGQFRFGDIDGDGRNDVVWLDTVSGSSDGSKFHVGLSQPTSQGIHIGADTCVVADCPQSSIWGNDIGRARNPFWQLLDFNIDGRADLLNLQQLNAADANGNANYEWEIWLSNGSAFPNAAPYHLTNILVAPTASLNSTPGPMPLFNHRGSASTYMADFDGDGLPDLMVAENSTEGRRAEVYLLKPTGNAAQPYVFQGPYLVSMAPSGQGSCYVGGLASNNFRTGDFDGDGRADFVAELFAPCQTNPISSYSSNVSKKNTTSASATVSDPSMPTITSMSTTSGKTGAVVTITGTNFTVGAITRVQFNGVLAQLTAAPTPTQITAVVPDGATSGPIAVSTSRYAVLSTDDFAVIAVEDSAATTAATDIPQTFQVMEAKGHDDTYFYFNPGASWPIGKLQDCVVGPVTPYCPPPQPLRDNLFQVIDLNGDGLPDVVFGNSDSNDDNQATFFYEINGVYNGPGGFSNPLCVISSCANSGGADEFQVGDYDGDGKGDVWLPQGNGTNLYTIYKYTDTRSFDSNSPCVSFSAGVVSPLYASDISSPPNRVAFQVDLDGDGYPDTLSVDMSAGTWATTRFSNHHSPRNVIDKITSGLGAITNIDYAPLTFSSVYDREYNAAQLVSGWGAPVQDVLTPRYVVQYADSSAPTIADPAHMSRIAYRYGGYKAQGFGRGSLGFHNIYTLDEQSGIATATTYNQAFPLTGTPAQTLAYAASSFGSDACLAGPDSTRCMVYGSTLPAFTGTLLNQTQDTWQWHLFGTAGIGAPALPSPSVPILVERTASQSLKYEINDATLISSSSVSMDYDTTAQSNGNLLDSTTNEYATASMAAADLLRQTTLVNTYYADDVTLPHWYLARLKTSTTTVTPYSEGTAGTAITRNSSFRYDASTGLLTDEHLQPNGSSDQALDKYHVRDSYGNEIESITCSASAACTLASPLSADSITFNSTDATWVQRYSKSDYTASIGGFPAGIYANAISSPFSNGAGGTVEATTLNITGRDAFGNVTDSTDVHNIETIRGI